MAENTNIPKLDKSKLTPEQRDKLETFEQGQQQIETLTDIAELLKAVLHSFEDASKGDSKSDGDIQKLLKGMRDSLKVIASKEDPEFPDHTQPIIDAIKKLDKSLSEREITVNAPEVNVEAPSVNVAAPDLTGIQKIIKTDIPAAFEKAMAKLPQPEKPDYSALLRAWEGISEQLTSIDTATRLKPQPGVMKVTNRDGSPIGSVGTIIPVQYDYMEYDNFSTTVDIYTYYVGGPQGTLVATVMITYTDTTKNQVSTVQRT